jgi:HAE1 family hydrophobic/amphiphilic exporter-1
MSKTQKITEKVARVNQKSAIILQIIKQSDANAVAVSEELVKTIAKEGRRIKR